MIEISSKTKGILVASGLLISFAMGRYSYQQPEVSTQINEKTTDIKQTEREDHSQTIIVHTKAPDGTEKTTTTISNNIDTKTKDKDVTTIAETQVVTPPPHDLWSVSAMVGLNPMNNLTPTYGAQVSKKILGPISIGAFGFTNGLVGLSVGVTF